MKSGYYSFLRPGLCEHPVLTFTSIAIAAHTYSQSSVDDSEIRWGGSNWYSSDRSSSIDLWNALGKINIAPDTASTYEDLEYSDVYRSDVAWAGRWGYFNPGTDTIEINNYYMDLFNDAQQKYVFAHELGHALGIDDHYDSSYAGTMMYIYVHEQTSLAQHDKDDYNSRWQ